MMTVQSYAHLLLKSFQAASQSQLVEMVLVVVTKAEAGLSDAPAI